MKTSTKNKVLIPFSFIFLIIYIWLRFLAERLPKEIPFALTTVSVVILICIIFNHIIGIINYIFVINRKNKTVNLLTLDKSIEIFVEGIFIFRRSYGEKFRFNLNFLYNIIETKIIPNTYNKTKYNYIEYYMYIDIFIRLLLFISLIIDIFYFKTLYYYYYVIIILSMFLLFHLFIKGLLKGILTNVKVQHEKVIYILKNHIENEVGFTVLDFDSSQIGLKTFDDRFIPYPKIELDELITLHTRQHLLHEPLVPYSIGNLTKPWVNITNSYKMINFGILCNAAFVDIELRKRKFKYWLIVLHILHIICWTYILYLSSFTVSPDLFIFSFMSEYYYNLNDFI